MHSWHKYSSTSTFKLQAGCRFRVTLWKSLHMSARMNLTYGCRLLCVNVCVCSRVGVHMYNYGHARVGVHVCMYVRTYIT